MLPKAVGGKNDANVVHAKLCLVHLPRMEQSRVIARTPALTSEHARWTAWTTSAEERALNKSHAPVRVTSSQNPATISTRRISNSLHQTTHTKNHLHSSHLEHYKCQPHTKTPRSRRELNNSPATEDERAATMVCCFDRTAPAVWVRHSLAHMEPPRQQSPAAKPGSPPRSLSRDQLADKKKRVHEGEKSWEHRMSGNFSLTPSIAIDPWDLSQTTPKNNARRVEGTAALRWCLAVLGRD